MRQYYRYTNRKRTNVVYEFSYNGKKFIDNVSCRAMTMAAFRESKRRLLIVFQEDDQSNSRKLTDVYDYARTWLLKLTCYVACD